MQYTITEFRKRSREILNEIDAGRRVSICRYDKVYNILPSDLEIVKKSGIQVVTLKQPSERIDTPKAVEKAIRPIVEAKGLSLCSNGHAIPEGRSKCMGKGCKYAG